MPIIRYVGSVDTLVRSYGKKVPVASGALVDVTEKELEALRKGGYKKYFAGTAGTVVAEVEPEDGEDVASGNVPTKAEGPKMPTKAEMVKELEALGREITPDMKKLTAERLYGILENEREIAEKAKTESEHTETDAPDAPSTETEGNAPESSGNEPGDTDAGEQGENANADAPDAPKTVNTPEA